MQTQQFSTLREKISHDTRLRVERKAAYSGAFAQVLRNAGIDCHAGSRLD